MREVPPAVLEMMNKHGTEFKEIFDAEINWFAGILCLFGIPDFDIVKLDDFLRKRGYREETFNSLADFVEARYGKRGRELIDELLSM